ncbi:FtsW/RodA/SpoVE family cell cycle protein, partial [Solicola sp. PLA-1-18]|uniref:FtsW/RodA/SpoVE family cell cycle protein n=1 Tax=Solicola sp. PLA-1-18 TaxID=3380532 RepID=UPI003B788E1C
MSNPSGPSAVPVAVGAPRKRRNAELLLVVMAVVICIGAYCAVGIGVSGEVPGFAYRLGGAIAGVALVTHLLVRRFAPYADPVLLPVVITLNGLGLAMIYRIDLARLDKSGGDVQTFAGQQLVWTALGIVGFVVVLLVVRDHRRLQSMTYTFGLLALVLLVLPLLPVIGQNINGARIWIRIGPMGLQPGEFAKIALAIFFAGYLVVKRDALALAGRRILGVDLPRGRDLGPILAAWLVSLGVLVFQRDLGSSLLFFGLFVVLLYVATERPGWLVVGGGLFLGGAYFAFLTFGHVQVRVNGWLDPFADQDRNFQIIQGLYGMAHGGLLGRGLGQGSPDITPYSYSDFIAASLGEELGLAGLMAILLMYGLIVERGLRIALICRDGFGKLLAAGLAVSIALQVFVVVGGVTRLIPLTGLTTPFLSYGGSSILANWAIVALLLRISDQSRRPAPAVV